MPTIVMPAATDAEIDRSQTHGLWGLQSEFSKTLKELGLVVEPLPGMHKALCSFFSEARTHPHAHGTCTCAHTGTHTGTATSVKDFVNITMSFYFHKLSHQKGKRVIKNSFSLFTTKTSVSSQNKISERNPSCSC